MRRQWRLSWKAMTLQEKLSCRSALMEEAEWRTSSEIWRNWLAERRFSLALIFAETAEAVQRRQ